jgi:long-subunit acyl-CoA synthetase (AMP-forming)
MYGMAECGLCVCAGVAEAVEVEGEAVVSCGPPTSSFAQIRIVEEGKVVENGTVGCIWVRSRLVASGYNQ